MPRWPASLRARLTLWYSVLLSLPLVAFAVASYAIVSRTLQNRTDRFIGDALSAFSRELLAERRTALTVPEAMRSTLDEVHFRDLHIAILDTTGAHIMAATVLPGDQAVADSGAWAEVRGQLSGALRGRDLTHPLALTIPGGEGSTRILSQPLAVSGQPFLLTGAYSLGDLEGVLGRIRKLFLIAIPVLIGSAAAGGYALARRSLAPVTSMAARATEITATNLGERLPVGGARELAGLAGVVNELLDRLEHSFAQQRRFVADASHELRTPTAIVRSEADVTLSQEHRNEAQYRASMAVVQDAARRLTRIVDDLFLLARADAGHLVARSEPLYLEDLVHDAARAMHTVADRGAVKIELRHLIEAPFEGDADLLGRLLLNLLDNAVKYSPAGGVVEVEMVRRGRECEITVTDGGPGIPPDLRDRVFEPFFRGDGARARSSNGESGGTTGGAGLGLAIARRIAEMHAGRLELAVSRPGRTEFRLTLELRG